MEVVVSLLGFEIHEGLLELRDDRKKTALLTPDVILGSRSTGSSSTTETEEIGEEITGTKDALLEEALLNVAAETGPRKEE